MNSCQNEDIRIRLANLSDKALIVNLVRQVDLLGDDILAPNTRYWVAEENNHILVGSVGLELGVDSALLRSVAVLPNFRNIGLGRNLVNTAMTYAKEIGCKRVFLFSMRSGKYWRKLGFQKTLVDELVQSLPDVPQVLKFTSIGKLAIETVWKKDLT
ncbi:MAG: GNAT family N-acetyltransferase [Anaerolineae bacterium]|nr:GNAT family N-acetyltransferase [Anaerolineae bacterium]